MRNVNPWILAALLVCGMSLWGCNQQKTGTIASKVKDLEVRYAKLEEEHKTLHAANEQNRKRLAAVEKERTALEEEKTELTSKLDSATKQLETTTGERDGLKQQVMKRTQERDTVQSNLVQFSRDLQDLASRIEAAATTAAPKASTPILPASRRND